MLINLRGIRGRRRAEVLRGISRWLLRELESMDPKHSNPKEKKGEEYGDEE